MFWFLRLIGIANNALYLGLGYIGLKTISAGLNALIVSANPVFVAVLAAMFLGEQITWQKVVGLLLGVAGVALIVAHRMSAGTDSPIGIAFSVGALVSIVAGTILFKVLAPKRKSAGRQWHSEHVGWSCVDAIRADVLKSFRRRSEAGDCSWRWLSHRVWIDHRFRALVSPVDDDRRNGGQSPTIF